MQNLPRLYRIASYYGEMSTPQLTSKLHTGVSPTLLPKPSHISITKLVCGVTGHLTKAQIKSILEAYY